MVAVFHNYDGEVSECCEVEHVVPNGPSIQIGVSLDYVEPATIHVETLN